MGIVIPKQCYRCDKRHFCEKLKLFFAFCLQVNKWMLTFEVSIPFTSCNSGRKWDGQLHNVKASLMLCLLVDEPRKFITNIKRHCQQWTLAAYAITVSRNVEGETCVLSLAHSGYTLYILTWVSCWFVDSQGFPRTYFSKRVKMWYPRFFII